MRRELIQVSAGLGDDGGGAAVVGRLIAAAAARFSRSRGLGFRILHLGAESGGRSRNQPTRHFGGRRLALALAAWHAQIDGRCAGLIFDHAGPSEIQALLPRRLRSPFLVFLLGVEVWRRPGWLRSRSVRGATALVAISDYTRRKASRFLPELGRAEVLHLALEDRDPAGQVDHGLLDRVGSGYLLIVGRLASGERYKGHQELLAVMPRLRQSCPEARLVIVGDGDDRGWLERQARSLGLGNQVVFTGFVSDATLRELYQRCAVFAMPSRGEGFGLVYLEAMRAGKPCVAARDSAAAEVVQDGETGLLVRPSDLDEVAAALETLMTRRELARELGNRGHERWRTHFSLEAFERGLDPLLERLIDPEHVRH